LLEGAYAGGVSAVIGSGCLASVTGLGVADADDNVVCRIGVCVFRGVGSSGMEFRIMEGAEEGAMLGSGVLDCVVVST